MSSRTAGVLTKGAEQEHFQSKQNGIEDNLGVVGTLDGTFKVNAAQNDKDSAVLSMLADHRELLMNVTKHLSEMKNQFKEYSDASTTTSKLLPKMIQRGTKSSVISSSNPSSYVGRSYFDKKTGKHMILVPRGRTESDATSECGNFCLGSSLAPRSTLKNIGINSARNNKMNIAKRAIMNAHEQSKKSNLFVASKMGMVRNEDGTTCKKSMPKKIPSDHARPMEVQMFGKGRQSSGVLQNHQSTMEGEINVKKGKSQKCRNFVIAEGKSKEGMRTRSFYKTIQNNGDIKRLCRTDRRRVMKQRLKDLPTVIGNIPMLEESSHERVQGWINNSLPVADIIEDETTSQIIGRCANKDRGDYFQDRAENTDWENVSSIMLSNDVDKSEGSYDWLTDDSSKISNESEKVLQSVSLCKSGKGNQAEIDQTDAMRHPEIVQKCDENQTACDNLIGEYTVDHSPINVKSACSMHSQEININESITPPSVLSTRMANNVTKAKRCIAFNKKDFIESESEKNCSSIVRKYSLSGVIWKSAIFM